MNRKNIKSRIKRRKLVSVIALATGVMILFGGTTQARGNAMITGQIESSAVDISVDKFVLDSQGNQVNTMGGISVNAGDKSPGTIRICNRGCDCYIRIIPAIRGITVNTEMLPGLFSGVGVNWVLKENGIYYLKEPLKSGTNVDFCDGINVPGGTEGKSFTIGYDIQAIQQANINPDMEALNPWGSIEVVESNANKSARSYKVEVLKGSGAENQNLTLHYNEDAQKLIPNFDNIFTGMGKLHPGDSYQESIELYNPTNNAKVLYIKNTTDHSEILDHVNISVVSNIGGNSTEIFNGSLKESSIGNLTAVGELNPGQRGELVVCATMDESVGNEGANLAGHISLTMEADNKGNYPTFPQTNQNNTQQTSPYQTPYQIPYQTPYQQVTSPNNLQDLNGDTQMQPALEGALTSEPSKDESSGKIQDGAQQEKNREADTATSIRKVKTGDRGIPVWVPVLSGILFGLAALVYPQRKKGSK